MTRPDGLTNQQYRVARLVAAGKTDKVIAKELNIGSRTVRYHISAIAHAWGITGDVVTRVMIARIFPEKAA